MSEARTPPRTPAAKEGPAQALRQLGSRAHQRHATARAADRFLDLDTAEDNDTGSWLVATAYSLALQLASERDNGMATARRPTTDKAPIERHDPSLARRVAAATNPVRGAA
jgi:hypothetical protein